MIVQPNTRVYKALRNQMTEILAELKRINNGADIDSDLLDIIQIMTQTYNLHNKDILPHLRQICNRR